MALESQLNHMININQVLESNTDEVDTEDKHDSHKDLGASRRKRDSEAIVIIGQWFDLRNPFDNCRDPKLLVSFATGYVSNEETDLINPEKFMTVGQSMNKTLDNKPFCTSMEVKSEVSPLSCLRNAPVVNNEQVHIYPLKLFNRLIIIVQRNETVQHALSYELTVVALSLFDNNLLMRKANKAVLG